MEPWHSNPGTAWSPRSNRNRAYASAAPGCRAPEIRDVAMIAVRLLEMVLIAVVTTSISLRLLGIRRRWTSAAFAAALGWGLAVFLALPLARWDWDADGLLLHAAIVGVPLTMAAAVAFDLVAQPGSLAVGERAGLVMAPRPFRAVRARIAVIRRYRELLRLARREGFGPFL